MPSLFFPLIGLVVLLLIVDDRCIFVLVVVAPSTYTTFDEKRRAVRMLNPVRDEQKRRVPGGGEGWTPVTPACPEDPCG